MYNLVKGKAVFKSAKNSNGLYRITHENMKRDVIDSVDVAGENINVSAEIKLKTASI